MRAADDGCGPALAASPDILTFRFNPKAKAESGLCLDGVLGELSTRAGALATDRCTSTLALIDRACEPYRVVVERDRSGHHAPESSWFPSAVKSVLTRRTPTPSQALEVYSLLEHVKGSLERIQAGLSRSATENVAASLGLQSVGGYRSLLREVDAVLVKLARYLSWLEARKDRAASAASPFCARMQALSSLLGQLATILTLTHALPTPKDADREGPPSPIFVPFHRLEADFPVEFSVWKRARYRYHLGYEFDKSLLDFVHQIAMFYAASLRAHSQPNELLKKAAFSTFASRYLLAPNASKTAALKLTANISLEELVMVWSVLEDDTIRWMAVNGGYFPHHDIDVDVPFSFGWRPAIYNVNPKSDVPATLDGSGTRTFVTDVDARRVDVRLIWHKKNSESARMAETASHGAPLRRRTALSLPSLPPAITRPAAEMVSTIWSVAEIKDLKLKPHVIFHVHGGGFISQTSITHNVYLHWWAHMTNIPILTVDYTLAPTERYPYALYECFEAYKWLLENHKRIGIATACDEPLKVVLVGDSAGGNLVSGVVQLALRHKIAMPCGLLLVYPAAHLTRTASFSRLVYGNDPVLSRLASEHCVDAYLGSTDGSSEGDTDPLISPAVAPVDTLKRFPRTFIIVGGIDPLLDDSVRMADVLRMAGVDVTLRVYDGLPHGFLNLSETIPNCRRPIVDAYLILQELLGAKAS